MTSGTLYLVPVDLFENYDHLQSAADMKPGLFGAFKWAQLGQIWAKFGPNQAQTVNFESRDPRLWLTVRF